MQICCSYTMLSDRGSGVTECGASKFWREIRWDACAHTRTHMHAYTHFLSPAAQMQDNEAQVKKKKGGEKSKSALTYCCGAPWCVCVFNDSIPTYTVHSLSSLPGVSRLSI